MTKTIVSTVIFAASAFAQPQLEQQQKMTAEFQGKIAILSSEGFSESSVAGAPYSAEETNTTTQTLLDGNRIVNTSTTKVYRDQQGRTRVERTLSNIGPLPAGQPGWRAGDYGPPSVNIMINDPVANTRFTLDPESKTAFKMPSMGTEIHRASEAEAALKKSADEMKARARTDGMPPPPVAGPNVFYSTSTQSGGVATFTTMQKVERAAKTEDLGTSNMAGVQVKGTRTTMVIPAGTIGNDRDINIVNERWYSPELKMNIMTKRTDPRMGETVFQVTNLTRANPDPSLFQVPADYQVKDAKGPAAFKVVTKE